MIRRIVNVAIVLAVIVLIGGIVLGLALPSLLSSDFGRGRVSDYCSRYLHRPVTIEKVTFSWGDGLSVTGATVTEMDRTPLLTLSSFRLAVSWSALLAGTVDIVAFDIKGADIIIRRDKDGELTISDLLAAPPTGEMERTEKKSSATRLPALFFKGSIRESNLTFVDERLKSTTRIEGLNADIVLPALDEPLRVRATCDVVLNDAPPEPVAVSGEAELAPAGRLDPYRGNGSLALQAGFGDLKLFFDLARLGDDEPGPADAAELTCSIDLQKLTRLMAGIVGLPPGFSLKGTLAGTFKTGGSLKSRVTVSGTSELKNLSITGGPLQARSFSQPRIVFANDIHYYPSNETVDISSFSLKGDFLDLALSGTVRDVRKNPQGTLGFSGTGNLSEIMLLAGKLLSLPPDLKLAGNVKISLSAEGDRNNVAIKGTTGCKDLSLNAAFLKDQPFRAQSLRMDHDLRVRLDKENRAVNAVDVTSLVLKGDFLDLTLSGTVSDVQKNPAGSLQLTGSGSLEEIVVLTRPILALPPDLRLSGDMNISLSAEGDRKGLAIKGTTGCKALSLNGDFLKNHPFRAAFLTLGTDAMVRIADREITVHSLEVRGDVMSGTLQGTIGSDGTCRLTGSLSSRLALLKENLQGFLPDSFPDDGQLVSNIELNGNLSKTLVFKGSHTIDGARIVPARSAGEPSASGSSALVLPRLTLVHDGRYAGDQETLSLDTLQVDSSLGNARWSGTLSRLSEDLFMNGKGDVSLNMTEAAGVLSGFLPEDLEAHGKATISLTCEGSLNPAVGSPLLSSWTGDATLTVESLDYAGIGSLRDLRSTNLSLDKGLLDAVLECTLNDGPARVEARCDCNREKPEVQVTAEVKGVPLSQDMRLLGYIVPVLIIPPDGELSGRCDFAAQASWRGTDWQSEIARTIEGKGTLKINEGAVRSRNVLSLVLKAFDQPERLAFETVLTHFRLGEGKVFNDDIQVRAKDFTLNLEGWTSLVYVPSRKGNPLEYAVRGDLIQKTVGGDVGKVLSAIGAGEMTLPVVIAGTVQDPTVSVKMPKAGDILRGIFGPDSP